MDFKKLNEQLNKFLEGDVVSFMDYKRNKVAQGRKERNAEFEKQFGDELQKTQDEWNKNNILITIDKIKVNWAEGPIKNPHYNSGQEFSYENFQEDVWARDYMNAIKESYDKCDITIFVTTNQGEFNREYKYRFTIGGGKEECDIYQALELIVKSKEGKTPVITNDPVKYNENYYKQLAKEYGIQAPVKEDPLNEPYVKDYSNNGTKTPQEVEVGDILYRVGGYSMTYYDYYKVIDKKKASIKLQNIGVKNISGDGWSGTCIPADKPEKDQYVDGKLFRIGYKYSKDTVCRVNGHSCYYWDGKPDYFNEMD